MRRPTENIQTFLQRRIRLAKQLQGSALIVCSHPEQLRNSDVGFAYRQDSNLYYLTGFEEPESILLFRPGAQFESVMFVRKRDKERETWDGFRFGPEGVQQHFGIDKVYPIEEFETQAPILLKGIESLYYRLFKHQEWDHRVQKVLETLKVNQGRTGYGFPVINDADTLLGEMRLLKTEEELLNLRKACDITSEAHIAAMRFTKPGVNERQVQAVIMHNFLMRGAAREGYNSIVASGNSATTLHYNFNDQTCQSGDLLLIDAGGEYNYFTSDITRTFPVSGKFSDEQALVYEGVLNVQKEIINFIKPGVLFKELQDMGVSLLTDLILELGLMTGTKDAIIESNQHKRFYPHGIGHWLGMDVHDAGLYYKKGEPRAIEENMVFTIEPGLYIPADDDLAPKKFRGIGVRIEDNLRVTQTGFENLTEKCPKEISELEKIIGQH